MPADERSKGTMQSDEVVRQYRAGKRDFRRADLRYADLARASLRGTHLSYANRTRVKVTTEQLEEAVRPQVVTMPDGTVHR